MADQTSESAERVSALVDGQLQGDELYQTLTELESSAEARSNWDAFHMLGEVMRSGNAQVRAHDAQFVARLRQRMAQNSTHFVAIQAVVTDVKDHNLSKANSANDGSWRRVAGFASVVLTGVLAWQGLNWFSSGNLAAMSQLALQQATPSPQPASAVSFANVSPSSAGRVLIRPDGTSALTMTSEPQVMIRDPQLDALLAAHRQLGGASVLQMPAGFLRNATFEEGPR